MMTKYIFGTYEDKDFFYKRTKQGWQGSSSDFSPINNTVIPVTLSKMGVERKLQEDFPGVNLYKTRLQEGLTSVEAKKLLKTKLGCLQPSGSVDEEKINHLFEDEEQKTLTDEATKVLEDIASSKQKIRIYTTNRLSNAWITIRGANSEIRKLDSHLGAYLFAYLDNGDILEGISGSGVTKYHVDLKDLTLDDIHSRFEDALSSIDMKDKILVNNLKIKGPKNEAGEVALFGISKKASISEINDLQKTFRTVFTKEPDNTKGLVSLIKKAGKKVLDRLFNPKEGKVVLLGGKGDNYYKIIGSNEVKMYYSKEEVDVARMILQKYTLTKPAKDLEIESSEEGLSDNHPEEKPSKDTENFQTTEFEKESPTEPGKSKFKVATENLGKEWNSEDAQFALKTVSEIMNKTDKIKSKEDLGAFLKKKHIIESEEKSFEYDLEEDDKKFVRGIIRSIFTTENKEEMTSEKLSDLLEPTFENYIDDELGENADVKDKENARKSLLKYTFQISGFHSELKENCAFRGSKESKNPEVIIEVKQPSGKWYTVGEGTYGYSFSKAFKVFQSEEEAIQSEIFKALVEDGYTVEKGNLRFSKD